MYFPIMNPWILMKTLSGSFGLIILSHLINFLTSHQIFCWCVLYLSVILEKVFLSGHVGMKLLMLCYAKNHEILENLLDWQLRFITILVTVEVYLHLFTVFLCISLNRCILGEAKVGSWEEGMLLSIVIVFTCFKLIISLFMGTLTYSRCLVHYEISLFNNNRKHIGHFVARKK
jgi:hypothetical protein